MAGFEPAASSSRSNLRRYALAWAKPNRGPLILTCANALSGSRRVGRGLSTLAPGLAPVAPRAGEGLPMTTKIDEDVMCLEINGTVWRLQGSGLMAGGK